MKNGSIKEFPAWIQNNGLMLSAFFVGGFGSWITKKSWVEGLPITLATGLAFIIAGFLILELSTKRK